MKYADIQVNHLFRTFLGLPPAKGIDTPLCGADLPDDWDFPCAGSRPECPECEQARQYELTKAEGLRS